MKKTSVRQQDSDKPQASDFDWKLPYQKRWEKKWPHLRVCHVPIDAGGGTEDDRLKVMDKRYKDGYVHDVTPSREANEMEFRWLMPGPRDTLLGKPLEEYEQSQAELERQKLPDVLDNSANPEILEKGGRVQTIS